MKRHHQINDTNNERKKLLTTKEEDIVVILSTPAKKEDIMVVVSTPAEKQMQQQQEVVDNDEGSSNKQTFEEEGPAEQVMNISQQKSKDDHELTGINFVDLTRDDDHLKTDDDCYSSKEQSPVRRSSENPSPVGSSPSVSLERLQRDFCGKSGDEESTLLDDFASYRSDDWSNDMPPPWLTSPSKI